jgi:DNA (cytosine-5)-methyltransferase 1
LMPKTQRSLIYTTAPNGHRKSNGNSIPTHAPKRKKRELFTLELCAGGGGAALGLERAGFSHVALLDNNPHACATLRSNRAYWNVIEADMRRFDASYWQDVDLLSGGLPCPPFSIAGKQLGADDDRNLFPAMLKIVKDVRPRAVVIENVRGILSARFAPFRAEIDRDLDALGFDSYWKGFNALDFGVPQNRYRAFLVALRRGATQPIQWPTPMANGFPKSVGESIAGLMAERDWQGAPAWAKKAAAPAPTIVGGSHKHGGPDLGPTRARREWAQLGVDGLGLADAPPEREFTGMPRLTVPMVAKLQSFPSEWKFAGSKTHAYRQVGNALPVELAFAMAKAVRKCLEK